MEDIGKYLVQIIKALIFKYANYIRLAQVQDITLNDPVQKIPYISVRYLDGRGEQTKVLLQKRTGIRIPKTGDIVIVGYRAEESPILLGILETDTELLSQLKENDVHIAFDDDHYIKYSNEEVNIKSDSNIDGSLKITGDAEIQGKLKVSGGSKKVARVGDSVSVYVPGIGDCTGTITTGSEEVKIE